jgi:hypothetical protein
MMRGAILSGVVILATATATRAADPPSFTKDVKPFLMKYCVQCHQGDKPKGGVLLDSYEALSKNTRKKVLVPGKPQMSLLTLTMESRGEKKMPPRKSKVQPTAKEIAVIKAWVTAGAKNDSATDAALPLQRADVLLTMILDSEATALSRRETPCRNEEE